MGRLSEQARSKIKNRYVTELSNIIVDGKPIGGLGNAKAALPDALKHRIDGIAIKHNAANTSVGSLRAGFTPVEDPREAPGAVHPVVKTHEETGHRALYLGRRDWVYIPGLALEKSEGLLDELWSYATRDEHVWRQDWQPDDVIIWDNRRVLHRRDAFDQSARRLMKRCQVLSRNHALH